MLHLDAWAGLSELTAEAVAQLNALGPFGTGNPEPVLGTQGAVIEQISTCGSNNDHLRLRVREGREQESSSLPAPSSVSAIWFGRGALASQLQVGQRVDVCYQPELDEWNGSTSVRLKLCDLATDGPLAAPPPAEPESLEGNGQCRLL